MCVVTGWDSYVCVCERWCVFRIWVFKQIVMEMLWFYHWFLDTKIFEYAYTIQLE